MIQHAKFGASSSAVWMQFDLDPCSLAWPVCQQHCAAVLADKEFVNWLCQLADTDWHCCMFTVGVVNPAHL
jgi:hypothetical protein